MKEHYSHKHPKGSCVASGGMKFCRGCEQDLPVIMFGKNNKYSNTDGLHPRCKICMKRAREQAEVRWSRRHRAYRITKAEYYALLSEQDGVCAICGKPQPRHGRSKDLVPDHDHATGSLRGLLCTLCNSGIGHMQHDPAILRSAAEYLAQSTLEVKA